MKKTQNNTLKTRISNRQRSEKTSAQLIEIARKLFASQGYSETSLEKIVQNAGMTRGALYHHFKGKKGVFLAVFENALAEIASRLMRVESENNPAWDSFMACTYEFYKACLDSDLQRIVLIDGPAVLGWDVWRQVDQDNTFDILRTHLKELLDTGIIHPMPIEPLTHFISGAVNETVLWIAGSENPEKNFNETWSALETVLTSLKK